MSERSREFETDQLSAIQDVVVDPAGANNPFTLHMDIRDAVPYVELHGNITGEAKAEAAAQFDELFARVGRRGVVLDFAGCTRFEYSATGALIAMRESGNKYGGVILVLHPESTELDAELQRLGVYDLYQAVDTPQAARDYMVDEGLLSRFSARRRSVRD